MYTIDGKHIAAEILERLKALPKPDKFLAAVLVGNDPASVSFLKQKEKFAEELGVDFRLRKFSADITNDPLREEVGKIAAHKTCGGVIVQLPLPEHLNRHYILNAIPREKDVDVLGERALGALYTGRNPVLPPAVGTVDEIICAMSVVLHDTRVVIIGRGLLVGQPIAVWLMSKVRELIVLGRNADLRILKEAELVISGVGKAGIVKPDMLKLEAGVIDFGYSAPQAHSRTDADLTQTNAEKTKISGDLDASGDLSKLSFYTPTPGGTGPILVAKLMENFYKLNER